MSYFRQKQIGKSPFNPGRRSRPGLLERRAIWKRHLRRFMLTKDLIQRKQPSVWVWTCGARSGFVSAFTLSEAKACAKEALGLKNNRLPMNVTIERIENESETRTSVEATVVSPESKS